jgi:hypothetical protein
MYLGIDFLITRDLNPYVVEVNIGLPGGAQEYELTHRVHLGMSSDIFEKIERTSREVYGRPFKEYLYSLPFIQSLRPFKIWMDGMGPFPNIFHPALRLEDKWNQYRLISPLSQMPETMIFDPFDRSGALRFLGRTGGAVLKRRVGRGGRGLQKIKDPQSLSSLNLDANEYLLQEYIESKIDGFNFSLRSVAFGGQFMCMYSNLSTRPVSNHGVLAFVAPGEFFGLAERNFETLSFNQKSWEADIWFGEEDPQYLKHNLYEDIVAQTALHLPEPVYEAIKEVSVKIERFYEDLDFFSLPKACFEE